MKKIISLVLITVMAMSVLVLVSCGGGNKEADYSDSKYVGTWKNSEVALEEESDQLDQEWILEIKADGTGTSTTEGDTGEFTWEPVDGGFKAKGDINLTFKDDGDKIVGDLFGVKLVFEKQE